MKVLALIGSPRTDGNTAVLVDQILKGVETAENSTEQIFLYDYTISFVLIVVPAKKGITFAALMMRCRRFIHEWKRPIR